MEEDLYRTIFSYIHRHGQPILMVSGRGTVTIAAHFLKDAIKRKMRVGESYFEESVDKSGMKRIITFSHTDWKFKIIINLTEEKTKIADISWEKEKIGSTDEKFYLGNTQFENFQTVAVQILGSMNPSNFDATDIVYSL